MNKRLVFLMPHIEKNVFAAEALVERQNLYSSYFAKARGDKFEKSLVLYSGTSQPIRSRSFDYIEPIWLGSAKLSNLAFFIKSLKQIQLIAQNQRIILIAGTPFQPLLIARLLSSRFRSVLIQVSIHGELGGVKQNYLKFKFLKSQLKRVSGIRFVSRTQREEFNQELKIDLVPSVVTPVPIEVNTEPVSVKPENLTLAFVGRVHAERDPVLWAEIAHSLPKKKKLIVGDGPLLNSMKEALPDAEFLGNLSNREIDKAWSRVGVLLSTAPFESYGLAVREALLHGVPVVARESAGVRDLALKFPKLVRLFHEASEASKLIESIEIDPPKLEEFVFFRDWFIKEQNESLQNLANLWDLI